MDEKDGKKNSTFTFNDKEDESEQSAGGPSIQGQTKGSVLGDKKSAARLPKKDEITWQLIDREGKGKIQYYGPIKMEAEYNVGTGDSVVKAIEPLTKASQMSLEANMKDAKSTINYNYTW